MIISRTPYRLSFFGGGTDYPDWYLNHGGTVLASAIDKYCYLMCRYLPPFFEHRYAVRYSRIETCKEIDEIQHPTAREILRYLKINKGVEINHDGDLPARSGMGSSSSFTVGLLNAIHALKGEMVGREALAREAIHIEQDIVRETVGSQDQIISAYGGINQISFLSNGEIVVSPITIPRSRIIELNSHIMLFYTGIVRTASDIAKCYVENICEKKRELRLMKDIVKEGVAILARGKNLTEFGHLMHENWEIKQSLSAMISNHSINEIYNLARSAGAIGGKISGAGGGGFMMLFVPPESHENVREKLDKFINVPFNFDFSGSQIIFHDPEEDYSEIEHRRSRQNITPFREL